MKTPEVSVMETDDPELPPADELFERGMKEMSPLLRLPAEVLQNVLFYMDSATFFTCLLSCRTVYQAAQSRRVVKHHLNRLPGLRLGLENLDNLNLFESFRRRAAKSLCGAGVLANITRYAPGDDLQNIGRAVLSYGQPTLLATAHNCGQVHIHELHTSENYVRLKAELRTETYHDQVLNRDYYMEMVKLAFSHEKDLAVLCRLKTVEQDPSPLPEDPPLPDDSEDELKYRTGLWKLVTFHRVWAKTRGYYYSSDQSVFSALFHPVYVISMVGLLSRHKGTTKVVPVTFSFDVLKLLLWVPVGGTAHQLCVIH